MGQPNPYNADVDAEAGRHISSSQEALVVKPITTWKGYIWDTWELPKDQRWLLFKLDAFVLTFASVCFSILWERRLLLPRTSATLHPSHFLT